MSERQSSFQSQVMNISPFLLTSLTCFMCTAASNNFDAYCQLTKNSIYS